MVVSRLLVLPAGGPRQTCAADTPAAERRVSDGVRNGAATGISAGTAAGRSRIHIPTDAHPGRPRMHIPTNAHSGQSRRFTFPRARTGSIPHTMLWVRSCRRRGKPAAERPHTREEQPMTRAYPYHAATPQHDRPRAVADPAARVPEPEPGPELPLSDPEPPVPEVPGPDPMPDPQPPQPDHDDPDGPQIVAPRQAATAARSTAIRCDAAARASGARGEARRRRRARPAVRRRGQSPARSATARRGRPAP